MKKMGSYMESYHKVKKLVQGAALRRAMGEKARKARQDYSAGVLRKIS